MTTTPQKWPNTLKAGCSAFLDTFSGLVPCKVLRVKPRVNALLHESQAECEVEVTETLGAYKKGEKIMSSARHTVPKGAVKLVGYHYRILPYNVEVTQ